MAVGSHPPLATTRPGNSSLSLRLKAWNPCILSSSSLHQLAPRPSQVPGKSRSRCHLQIVSSYPNPWLHARTSGNHLSQPSISHASPEEPSRYLKSADDTSRVASPLDLHPSPSAEAPQGLSSPTESDQLRISGAPPMQPKVGTANHEPTAGSPLSVFPPQSWQTPLPPTPDEDSLAVASVTSEEDPLGAASGEVPHTPAASAKHLIVIQEQMGALEHLQDLFLILLRSPPWVFACAVVLAPVLCALFFTPLYLLDLRGLIVDDSVVRAFKQSTTLMAPFPRQAPSLRDDGTDATTLEEVGEGLADPRVWLEVYGFCLGLQTGLEQKLYPNSWYSMGLANLNALSAQLLVVFMTGTVFARLSQPASPIRCSSVALVSWPLELFLEDSPESTAAGSGEHLGGTAGGAGSAASSQVLQGSPESNARAWSQSSDLQCPQQQQGMCRMLLVRYVLAGPQPMELVDLRIELSLSEDSTTPSGSFFRRVTSLQLLRSTSAYQKYGMLIRHPINESSPLFGRTQRDLEACNAELTLCIMGLERASMQPVFQVQHYFARDGDIVWGAEFEDMVRTDSDNTRIMDQRKLNSWKLCSDRSSSTVSSKK